VSDNLFASRFLDRYGEEVSDVFGFRDVISFHTNIPYNLDLAVILFFSHPYHYSLSRAYHLR
jgi:hypothetical protein